MGKKRGNRSAVRLLEKVFPLMMATPSSELPAHPEKWLYELKYDGFRAAVAFSGDGIEIWSRNRNSLVDRFPRLIPELVKLKLSEPFQLALGV